MGCATKAVQYLFFACNFLFFCLGIAVLAVGIYSRVENDTWNDLIDSNTISEAANLLIVAGVIVGVVGFLGCCGACKRWQWMLGMYTVFVILIFAIEIAAGVYAYTKRDTVQNSLTNKLDIAISKNYGQSGTASKGMTAAVDWFQKNVKCCGSSEPSDWMKSKWYEAKNTTQNTVPKSCCKTRVAGCNIGMDFNSTNLFTEGCVEKGKKFAKKHLWLIGGVGIGVAVVQLLGLVSSVMLCKTYRDEEKSGNTA